MKTLERLLLITLIACWFLLLVALKDAYRTENWTDFAVFLIALLVVAIVTVDLNYTILGRRSR